MARAKKRVAARKQSSKRGKANSKVSAKRNANAARKIAAKRATLKKAKSKVGRAGTSARKSAARKRREPEMMEALPVAEIPVETTIIDVIEEPAASLIAATEYHSIQVETAVSACDEPNSGEVSIGPADISTIASDQAVPEHEAEEQRGTWSE
jgi:hypothetical protein